MAIARAQLMKELLPGLNALFGMEYARYPKNGGRASRLKNSTARLRKRPNCRALVPPL